MKAHRTIRYTLSNTDMTIIYARKDEHGTRQKMWTMLNEIIASDCPAVGFDIETYKLEEFKDHPKAGLAPRITGIRLLQFYLPDGRCYIFDAFHDEEHVLSLLQPVFKRKVVVGHYVQFDLAHLRRYVKYPIKAHCTQIMYNTYRHASFVDADDEEAKSVHDVDWLTKKDTHSASLRYITGTLLGIQVDKNMQTSNWNAEELSQEQLVYAAADVKYTYDCAKVLQKKINRMKLGKIYELYRKALDPVVSMHNNGIYVDIEAHNELIENWTEQYKEAETELKKRVKVNNLNSTKQLSEWLENTDKISDKEKKKWPKSAKSGLFSMSADVLKNKRHLKFADHFLEYKKKGKLLSTYGAGLRDKINPVTKRIHCSYTLGYTATGRLSSRDPNLTNQPRDKDVRSIYSASRSNNRLVGADYSQIEMRVAAHLSRDPSMLMVFSEGKDIYRYTASKILGKKEKDISGEERQKAKAVVLGLIFGLGANGLVDYSKNSYGVIVSHLEAEMLYSGFFKAYKSYALWQKQQRDFAKKNGFVLTAGGKKRRLDDEHALYTKSVNTPVQGTAAEIMLQALILVNDRIKKAALLLSVHDEIILECRAKDADYIASSLNEYMVEAADMILPGIIQRNLVEVKIGNNWGETK